MAEYGVEGVPPGDPDTFDLQADSNGWAAVQDADGDRTWVDWRVPIPNVRAIKSQFRVDGWDWSSGTATYLTIDDPSTPDKNPDFTAEGTVGVDEEFPDRLT